MPWSARGALRFSGGLQAGHGTTGLRDARVGARWVLVNKPELVVRVGPGLTLPVGVALGGLGTPGSTSSFDPYASIDAFYGSTWVVGGWLSGRAPVYAGGDGVRQGAFGRADLIVARRLSAPVLPWLGLSSVGALDGDNGAGGFHEQAAIGGAIINATERWSLNAQVRAPFAGSTPYRIAGGVGVTRVFGGSGDADVGGEGSGAPTEE